VLGDSAVYAVARWPTNPARAHAHFMPSLPRPCLGPAFLQPTWQYVNVFTRSPPYIAGMLAAVCISEAARLPTAADPQAKPAQQQATPEDPRPLKPVIEGAWAVAVACNDGAEDDTDGAKASSACEGSAEESTNCFHGITSLAAGAAAAARRVHWLDWTALALSCGLVYTGVGMNWCVEVTGEGEAGRC